MSSEGNSDNSDAISIGRIPLKQVRVKRNEASSANPMNRLVPYLDLFSRLADDELARLAHVDEDVAATLRKQVVAIDSGLERYVDLLPRLSDTELVRLTGATAKTIRFWRLCQPRISERRSGADVPEEDAVVARAAAASAPTAAQPAATKPEPKAEPNPTDSLTRGMVPVGADERIGGSAADDPAETPAEYPATGPAAPKHPTPDAASQVSASRFMQFSGEPFPGFEDPTHVIPDAELEEEEVPIEDLTEDDLLEEPPQSP